VGCLYFYERRDIRAGRSHGIKGKEVILWGEKTAGRKKYGKDFDAWV